MAFLGCPEGFGKKPIAAVWERETDLKPYVAMERCLPESVVEEKVYRCAQFYGCLKLMILSPDELADDCYIFRVKNT